MWENTKQCEIALFLFIKLPDCILINRILGMIRLNRIISSINYYTQDFVTATLGNLLPKKHIFATHWTTKLKEPIYKTNLNVQSPFLPKTLQRNFQSMFSIQVKDHL